MRPHPKYTGAPDPAIIWFFDSSRQLLIFRDSEKDLAVAWPESLLVKCGWNATDMRKLPRISVQP